jgi:hypothetical protein
LSGDISILPDREAVIFIIAFTGAAAFSPETETAPDVAISSTALLERSRISGSEAVRF